LARAITERRQAQGFLLTARVFLPDPSADGHAILFPRCSLTVSRVMESIKVSATREAAEIAHPVIPAKAGIQWTPAFAGVTPVG
jgi:hypothetical protein